MRLGLIGRADEGGLAALTCELARHLKPDACLVVELGDAGRGRFDLNRIAPHCGLVATCGNPLDDQAVRWLLKHADVVYTAETTYRADLYARCQATGVKLIMHAMPELHRRGTQADVLLNPTSYGADRLPQARLLPVPVARDRLPHRQRTEAQTLLHVAAPAMLDRNGTMLVALALAHVRHPCRVLVANADPASVARYASRHVQVAPAPRIGEYWQRWVDEVDVLLLPRRYAGLCLPAQEAAAAGIPTVALSTDIGVRRSIRVPATVARTAQFAGGTWPVHACTPEALAGALNHLLEEPATVKQASADADAWAAGISWEALQPVYEELLRTA